MRTWEITGITTRHTVRYEDMGNYRHNHVAHRTYEDTDITTFQAPPTGDTGLVGGSSFSQSQTGTKCTHQNPTQMHTRRSVFVIQIYMQVSVLSSLVSRAVYAGNSPVRTSSFTVKGGSCRPPKLVHRCWGGRLSGNSICKALGRLITEL